MVLYTSLLGQDHLIIVDEPLVGAVRVTNVNLANLGFVWVFGVPFVLVAKLPAEFVGACRVEAFVNLVLPTVTFLGTGDFVCIVIDGELTGKCLIDHEQGHKDAEQRNR